MNCFQSLPRFQFHKGTIKTVVSSQPLVTDTKFQFHKGTIKTGDSQIILNHANAFQFHKGTIKTKRERTQQERKEISIP